MQQPLVEVAQVLLELDHWTKYGMFQKAEVIAVMVRHLTQHTEQ